MEEDKYSESYKVKLKRALYVQSGFSLMRDSLTGEVINPLFESVDRGLYQRLQQRKTEKQTWIDKQMNELRLKKKIILRAW